MNDSIPIFSHYQTCQLLEPDLTETVPLSVDLGRSTDRVQKTPEGWRLPDRQLLTWLHIQKVNHDENGCFRLINGALQKAAVFSKFTQRYYSLMPTSSAPTMLISGIPMHRTKGITPWQDTKHKLSALGTPYGIILDTTTGLGYTAIQASRTADMVITIELDPAVLSICRMNPWSQELFKDPRIHHLIGDSVTLMPVFPDGSFDAIIHDPPTFNLAGQLYSKSIYREFHRILKSRGRLFHYIGDPGSRTGASVGRGVVERLQKAGFTVTPRGNAFGVLAKKAHARFF